MSKGQQLAVSGTKLVRENEQEIIRAHLHDVESLLLEVVGQEGVVPSFEIENEEDFQFAGELLKFVKKRTKELEDRRKTVTKPLDEALKAFRAWYKPSLDQYAALERALKRRISAWQLEQDRREEEAVRKIAEASMSGDYDAAHAASTGLVKASTVSGVTVRKHWVLDEDSVDLSKVPVEFLALDRNVVAEYIRQFGKDRPKDLPGLKFKRAVQVKGSRKG